MTARLRDDHRRAEEVLAELDRLAAELAGTKVAEAQMPALKRIQRFLQIDLPAHMRQEDEVLFPALVPFISWGSPMSMMAKEHRLLHEEIDLFGQAVAVVKPGDDGDEIARLGKRIAQRLRDDFYQEENVLFVEADESLTGARAEALVEAMTRIAKAGARAD
ncbi:MAG: hemerythrin domain-containing protein [Planctomycetota bacterium]|nr:hemerythrin domain-containing protein [Planctomycetota bacterium]